MRFKKKGVSPLNRVTINHMKEHLSRQLNESDNNQVLVIPRASDTVLMDAISACEDYFVTLVSVVYDAYDQFKNIVDPRWYYTRENFHSQGRSFVDALAELGFPPEWASVVPSEAIGWQILRSKQPPCILNSVFDKYLKKTIGDPDQIT